MKHLKESLTAVILVILCIVFFNSSTLYIGLLGEYATVLVSSLLEQTTYYFMAEELLDLVSTSSLSVGILLLCFYRFCKNKSKLSYKIFKEENNFMLSVIPNNI